MKSKSEKIGLVLKIAVITLLSILTLLFFYLYIFQSSGWLYNNRKICLLVTTIVVVVLTAIAITFQLYDKQFVFRLCFLVMLIASIAMILLYLMQISGFWDKVDSVEDMREFIASTGGFAVIVFIFIQFLQVVILPIPGIVSIGAGTALFGPLYGSIYSFIGIILGSLFGFFFGRIFGYKATKWLVGDGIDKALESVKGKDKIVLSFMFILPFFPDDILCFVAGMSSMSVWYFVIMIIIARLLAIFITSFSVSGSLIPYNTWWGILIWCLIFVLTAILTVIIYKKGDKIEKFFSEKFKRKQRK